MSDTPQTESKKAFSPITLAYNLNPGLAQAVADTLMSFQLEGTTLQDQFVDRDGFAPLSYQDSFALVRLIDDTVGFRHTIKGPADDVSDRPTVN